MFASLAASFLLLSAVSCENGVCRLVPDEPAASSAEAAATQIVARASAALPSPDRIAEGAMSEREFLGFLAGDGTSRATELAEKGLVWILLLAVLGGLAINLTPCVLPMVPVNLIVIGASPLRGFLYGLGQFLVFGTLGLLAAIGGTAFGTIQSSPWFNLAVAILFAALAVALAGFVTLDFSRFRRRLSAGAFVLGAVAALLAGACVAPILVSVLVLSARLSADGSWAGYLLPFAVAFGLALPWPFLGAGLKVLPKPGSWMKWVNRAFAILVAVLSVHYLLLAVGGLRSDSSRAPSDETTPRAFAESALLRGPRARPLLVFCHADWCRNCPAMERLMATSPRVREKLRAMDVVRLRIQKPSDLAGIPGLESIRGLPAFAFYGTRLDID